MLLLGGMLCEVVYTNPLLPPFYNLFYFNQRGRVWDSPSHGSEIFENLCMKMAFSCTCINAIIRGSLCGGIDQFSTCFPFLFYRRSTGGGGMIPLPPPPSPLATPVAFDIY